MNMWRKYVTRIGLWMIRTLVREGKKELVAWIVQDIIEDPKVPEIGNILELGGEFNPFRR